MSHVRMIGAETVAACITDGGADWTACEDMVRDKFPWIFFLHCAGHILSLIFKDICSIDEVNNIF